MPDRPPGACFWALETSGLQVLSNEKIGSTLYQEALIFTLAAPSWPGARFGCPGHLRFVRRCADGRDTHSSAPGHDVTVESVSAALGITS